MFDYLIAALCHGRLTPLHWRHIADGCVDICVTATITTNLQYPRCSLVIPPGKHFLFPFTMPLQ